MYTYRNWTVKKKVQFIYNLIKKNMRISYAWVLAIVCARKLMLTINKSLVRRATFPCVTGGNWSACSHPFCPDMGNGWPAGWGVARPVDIPGPDNRSVLLAVMLVPGLRSQAPKALCGWNTRRAMLDQHGPDSPSSKRVDSIYMWRSPGKRNAKWESLGFSVIVYCAGEPSSAGRSVHNIGVIRAEKMFFFLFILKDIWLIYLGVDT